MMFVMSLNVDSSQAAKSLDSHSQAITHTQYGPHKLAEGLLVSKDVLIGGCGDRQINEPCLHNLHNSPLQFQILSPNFVVLLTFMTLLFACLSCLLF